MNDKQQVFSSSAPESKSNSNKLLGKIIRKLPLESIISFLESLLDELKLYLPPEESPHEEAVLDEKQHSQPEDKVSEPLHVFDIKEIESEINQLSANTQNLLIGRITDLNMVHHDQREQACKIVDLLDELHILSCKDTEEECIESIEKWLEQGLQAINGELIFLTEWTPELQRAIEIEYCLPADSISTLKEHKAYGLKLKGKLIRKQEVSVKSASF